MANTILFKRKHWLAEVNDTHREKLFYSVQYKNGWSAASDLSDMFTQAVKFYYTFYDRLLRVHMFEKCDSLNRQ